MSWKIFVSIFTAKFLRILKDSIKKQYNSPPNIPNAQVAFLIPVMKTVMPETDFVMPKQKKAFCSDLAIAEVWGGKNWKKTKRNGGEFTKIREKASFKKFYIDFGGEIDFDDEYSKNYRK